MTALAAFSGLTALTAILGKLTEMFGAIMFTVAKAMLTSSLSSSR